MKGVSMFSLILKNVFSGAFIPKLPQILLKLSFAITLLLSTINPIWANANGSHCIICNGQTSCENSFCQGTLVDNEFLITSAHCFESTLHYQSNYNVRCGEGPSSYTQFSIVKNNNWQDQSMDKISDYNVFQNKDLAVVSLKPEFQVGDSNPKAKKIILPTYEWFYKNYQRINTSFVVPETFPKNWEFMTDTHGINYVDLKGNKQTRWFNKFSQATYINKNPKSCLLSTNLSEDRQSSQYTKNWRLPENRQLVIYQASYDVTNLENAFNKAYIHPPYLKSTRIYKHSDSGGSLICPDQDNDNIKVLAGVTSTNGPTWSFPGEQFQKFYQMIKTQHNENKLESKSIDDQEAVINFSKSINNNSEELLKIKKHIMNFNKTDGQIFCKIHLGATGVSCRSKIYFNIVNREYDLSKINSANPIKFLVSSTDTQTKIVQKFNQYFFLKCRADSEVKYLDSGRLVYQVNCLPNI